jgi:hypothetical protein
MPTKGKTFSGEIEALSTVLEALADLDDAKRSWVLQTASARLNVAAPSPQQNVGVQGPAQAPGAAATGTEDPRQFVKLKNPQTDVQRVACLAYYLTHYRDQAHFKSRDLSTLNTEAAGPRVNMSRAVNNATNQNRYLAAAGSGNKQISPLGEDVVNALPDQEKVTAAEQNQGRRKKRPGRKRKPRASKASS